MFNNSVNTDQRWFVTSDLPTSDIIKIDQPLVVNIMG